MAIIRILGNDIDLEFRQGEGAEAPPDQAAAIAGLNAMAALINSKAWPEELAQAYTGLEKIVFFNGSVVVNTHVMSRPGIDERAATFYWEEAEFNDNDSDGHANTLFHDGWHVVQFKAAGDRHAFEIEDRIDREVDATRQQIKAARLLGSSEHDIADLEDYSNDRNRIRARLLEGVG